MQEIWKDIENYEGLYQVSNLGEIKSLERPYINQYGLCGMKKEKILTKKIVCFDKKKKEKSGYYAVNLSNNDRGKWKRLHIIVAKAFIPNPHNKPQVNHINGNKLDNRAENLEWVTHKENCIHAWRTGLHKNEEERIKKIKESNIKTKKITDDIIKNVYSEYKEKKISMHKLAKKYNISVQSVSNIINKKNPIYQKILGEKNANQRFKTR